MTARGKPSFNNFLNKFKITWITLAVLGVFLLAFSTRLYWIGNKTGIHLDEGFTHILSSFREYGWGYSFPYDKELTGAYMMKMMYGNINDPAKNLAAFEALRKTNNYDLSHPNLYYLLYRLSATVNGSEVLTLKEFIKTGCGLNMVLFCFSFLFMYFLLKKLFTDQKLIPLGLAAAFLNTGGISNTLFIREYQLQETALILFTLLFVIYYKKEKITGWKDLCIIAAATAFALLSGYFALIYMGMLGLILLIRHKKTAGFVIAAFTAGFILTLAAYPMYFDAFASLRAKEITDMTTIGKTFGIFKYFIHHFIAAQLHYWLYIPAAAFLILCLALSFIKKLKKDPREKTPLVPMLIAVAFVWCFIAFFLAPYKLLRYIVPVFPILTLITPYIFSRLRDEVYKISAALFVFMLVFSALFAAVPVNDCDDPQFGKIPAGVYVQMTGFDSARECRFMKKSELPVVILLTDTDAGNQYLLSLVPHFPPDQKYLFSAANNPEVYNKYKHFFLVVEDGLYYKGFAKPPQGDGTILDVFSCGSCPGEGHFTGFEISRP